MMGLETIRELQLEAAARAAREGNVPFIARTEDDIRAGDLPFLGTHLPRGWRYLRWDELPGIETNRHDYDNSTGQVLMFVDASGFGSEGEGAYTIGGFLRRIGELTAVLDENTEVGWAVWEAGQFQVHVAGFVKDPSSTGSPADETVGLCPRCGEEDGVMDYHDCEEED